MFFLFHQFSNYLPFQSFDYERTWWMLFQKRVVSTKFDICFYYNFKSILHLNCSSCLSNYCLFSIQWFSVVRVALLKSKKKKMKITTWWRTDKTMVKRTNNCLQIINIHILCSTCRSDKLFPFVVVTISSSFPIYYTILPRKEQRMPLMSQEFSRAHEFTLWWESRCSVYDLF